MLNKNKPTEKLDEVLKELPEDKREVVISAFYAVARSYSSPLPPPDDFDRYEKTLPNSMDRILTMTEKQVDHRINLENKEMDSKIKQGVQGQKIGASLVALFGTFAFVLGLLGRDDVAKYIGVATVIGIAIIFVLRQVPIWLGQKE